MRFVNKSVTVFVNNFFATFFYRNALSVFWRKFCFQTILKRRYQVVRLRFVTIVVSGRILFPRCTATTIILRPIVGPVAHGFFTVKLGPRRFLVGESKPRFDVGRRRRRRHGDGVESAATSSMLALSVRSALGPSTLFRCTPHLHA